VNDGSSTGPVPQPAVAARNLPARVDAVLFDAGGVLLDLDFAYLRRVLSGNEIDVTEEDLARVEARARLEIDRGGESEPALGWRDFFLLVLGRVGVPIARQDRIVDTLWEAHQRVGLWTVAAPGGPATVSRVRQAGMRVAVVSNAEGQVSRDLDVAGYAGLFETVVDSQLVGARKPDPEIFRIALGRLKLAPQNCVYVGDIPRIDVAGARAAGVAPVLVDRHGFHGESDTPRIRELRHLPALLGLPGQVR